MNQEKIVTISIVMAASAVFVCLASAFFSYRAYVNSQQLTAEYRNELMALKQSYALLEEQYAGSTNLTQSASNVPLPAPREKAKPGSDQDNSVQRLEKIINSTGLGQLAAGENIDPTILAKVYEDYALQDQVRIYHEQTLVKNREMHQSDREEYDEEVMTLYEQARLRRRGEGNTEDREKAFNELLIKYPDAYATGMAIAERALRSAFRRNDADVQNYYNMLQESEYFSNIVTDRGMEAMPSLESYLAYTHIRDGRVEEATALIQSLEGNYPGSYVLMRGGDRRMKWVPAGQVVQNLKGMIE